MRRPTRSAVRTAIILGSSLALAVAVLSLVAPDVTAQGQMKTPPTPGLHAYTMGHAMRNNPPDRLGGPLTVKVTQTGGSTRLVLPGPRFMDPSVFGDPDNPVGFDPAPFPLLGVPLAMRNTHNDAYSFVDQATPFGNWREVGVGDVSLTAVDATAVDGARTKDKVDFEANFTLPDGAKMRVTCNKPLAHGMAYPFFGGVATNQLMHGATGIGTRLMPTEFSYVAFWGVGNIYRNGTLVNENHLIHVMVTEVVRGDNYQLDFDGAVGNPPEGVTMHLMIPPYKPTPQGMQPAPVKTGFMPFPFVKPHMMAAMQAANKLPAAQKAERLAVLGQVKALMDQTKEHVMAETKAGKMAGMPFIHIMFGNVEMETEG